MRGAWRDTGSRPRTWDFLVLAGHVVPVESTRHVISNDAIAAPYRVQHITYSVINL